MRGPTIVLTHGGLSPHQFTPVSGAHKSLQATRDDVSSSAIADDVIRPACLSSPLGRLPSEKTRTALNDLLVRVRLKGFN